MALVGAPAPASTAGRLSGNLDAAGAARALASRRGRQGNGLNAEEMGCFQPVPD